MAKSFSTRTLLLNKQELTTSGDNLLINGLIVNPDVYFSDLENTSGILTTQIQNIENNTGNFLISSQTGNLADKDYVFSVSGVLNNKIASSSAGVTSINSLTGEINFTEAGNISITENGQNIIISGDLSSINQSIQSTGSNLQTQITNITENTGEFVTSGDLVTIFYPLNDNPNNYITNSETGNLADKVFVIDSSGVLNTKIENLSGYSNSTFSTIANLSNTGQTLITRDDNISGALQSQIDNISPAETGSLTGVFYPLNDNPANYIDSSQTGSFITSAVISLNNLNENVNITGLGNISVSTAGQNIRISGAAGEGAGESNTASTLGNGISIFDSKDGVDLRFNSISGQGDINVTLDTNTILVTSTLDTNQFYSASNPLEFAISGDIQSTGNTLDTKINTLSGYSNNTFETITNVATTGQTLDNKINNLSGYSNSTFATITNLQTTGETLNTNKLSTTAFSGLTKITVSATEPTSPNENDLWVDLN